jgi:tRNA(Ile)-lysidine synthase
MAKKDRSPALYEGVKRFIRTQDLIRGGSKVIAAVSGGIDSVVLLDLLSLLSAEWKFELAILHVNHQLRGKEADADERFVRSLAERRELPLFVARVDTKKEAAKQKISIQEAARNLRYAFFVTKKSELRADAVATAHNANDNAETMLLNFFRGTGIDGLAGIPVRRDEDSIVRPLLFATRAEIAAYAREKKLKFREDSSNRSDKYSRNFLRRNVIPLLEKRINPSMVRTLSQTSAVFRNCAEYLAECIQNAFPAIVAEENGEILFRKGELRKQHPYLRQMIVHDALLRKRIEPSFERIAAVLSLLDVEKGSRVDCGSGWRAENESDRILLSRRNAAADFSYLLKKEGTVANDFFTLSVQKCSDIPNKLGARSSIEYVDARMVRFPLRVRSWNKGDFFIPLGMKHRKKVSDLFVDLKISRSEKNRIPIVESDGKIVWVAGIRLDDRCKITTTTTKAYKFSITRA